MSERSKVWSWALYDWANSAFATVIMAGFFPIFFREFWAVGRASTETTFLLGAANSGASLLIVVAAPILGAIADQGFGKKRFLGAFALLGIGASGTLFFIGEGHWLPALLCYATALIGFSGSIVFYDAMLVDVAPESKWDRVSAFGYALGYLGGGALFAFNVLMTLKPHWFGLADAAEAVRYAFLMVACWWMLFSIPLFLNIREPDAVTTRPASSRVLSGFRELASTFGHLRRYRHAFVFLGAYWLYIDGVDTIVRMAVDYGLALGIGANDLIAALLITQFVGFPAAVVFGRLGERFGPKRGIFLAIAVYFGVILWAYRMASPWEFYLMAGVIGLVQGGIQALSRSFYARLIPQHRATQFFGFYNMLGKFAAVIGPVLMGWTAVLTGDARASILSVAVLFFGGALLLALVDPQEGQRMARDAERKRAD